jgi:PAS domain S-box-containing protein
MNTDNFLDFNFSGESYALDFELLKLAIDASIAGIIITDYRQPDHPIVYCNMAFEKISGYKRDEIIGRNCRFLQGDDREQKARYVLKEAIKKGETTTVELRNYRKNGDLFWNELYLSPVKDANGSVTHFMGVQNDITKRKNAEQQLQKERDEMERRVIERTKSLKENQDYLASILQTVRESLLVLGPDLRVLSANTHFLRTFKVSEAETIGVKLYDLGEGQWNIARLKELLETILPSNNPVLDFEVNYEFPHIGKKIMLLNAHQIELDGEYKQNILLSFEDITDRKEAEQRKDDFISIASHELRSPLTTVKGYIQLLERLLPKENDKVTQAIAKTNDYLNRMNELITNLLDTSKIQNGKIELHKEVFDFDLMVKEAVENVQGSYHTHKIVITGSTKINYAGDQHRLEQVIINLLTNAIKYSPEATEIAVYLSRVSGFIKVAVTDYGLGIRREDQKKVFERFFRANSIQKKFPGMGIGLYVCDQIIKNHQGTLWVDSEANKGATFSFTLPI